MFKTNLKKTNNRASGKSPNTYRKNQKTVSAVKVFNAHLTDS